MTTSVLQFVPLAADHLQAADVLAKGGIVKGIGKFLLFGVLILVLLGVFIGMKARGRRR